MPGLLRTLKSMRRPGWWRAAFLPQRCFQMSLLFGDVLILLQLASAACARVPPARLLVWHLLLFLGGLQLLLCLRFHSRPGCLFALVVMVVDIASGHGQSCRAISQVGCVHIVQFLSNSYLLTHTAITSCNFAFCMRLRQQSWLSRHCHAGAVGREDHLYHLCYASGRGVLW